MAEAELAVTVHQDQTTVVAAPLLPDGASPPRTHAAGRVLDPTWAGVLCGAPRRNRTADPILTMEPPGTAVRKIAFPGRARPSGPKLSVLS